jgi:polar amino acid transport system substrate-binding protein
MYNFLIITAFKIGDEYCMKRMITLLLVILSIAALPAGCAGPAAAPSATPAAKKILKVGMELAYPPFETKDNAGTASGVSVDLAKAFAESMGMEAEIQNIAWDGLIPSLQTGKVDVVISSMTITEKRKEQIDFSEPYAKAYLALLVGKNSPVQTAGDLNAAGRVIAVKQGSTGDSYARQTFPKAKINAFDSENACVTEVSQGKADAFIYDQLTIYRNSLQFADKTKALYIPSQNAESWGMAFKKGSELSAKANAFLKKYTADGGFEKLTEKYLKQEKLTFDKMGFAFFFADKSGKWPV